MKSRKTGKSNKSRLTFGERNDQSKISKINNLKTSDKLAKQITKGLYAGGRGVGDTRQIMVKVKGGYNPKYAKQLDKKGVDADGYYTYTFLGDPDEIYTPAKTLDLVGESMEKFTGLKPSSTGSTPTKAAPRIREIEIEYLYFN